MTSAHHVFVVGDAWPLLPHGKPGVVDVIAVGAVVGSALHYVPVVLRNNTDEAVVLNRVHGTAQNAIFGGLITSTSDDFFSLGSSPYVVPVGQVAIAVLQFGTIDDYPVEPFVFKPDTESVVTASGFRHDLEVVEASRREQSIVGLVRNGTDEPLTGFMVIGACFNADGAVNGYYSAIHQSDLDPGETVAFDAGLATTGPCNAFLLSATENTRI